MTDQAEALALKALQLHEVYERVPTDRGGSNGPKGQAWRAFCDAKDAALRGAPDEEGGQLLCFEYVNHRGEHGKRAARFKSVRFGTSDYYKEPQFLMLAYDVVKQADREFAMANVSNVKPCG